MHSWGTTDTVGIDPIVNRAHAGNVKRELLAYLSAMRGRGAFLVCIGGYPHVTGTYSDMGPSYVHIFTEDGKTTVEAISENAGALVMGCTGVYLLCDKIPDIEPPEDAETLYGLNRNFYSSSMEQDKILFASFLAGVKSSSMTSDKVASLVKLSICKEGIINSVDLHQKQGLGRSGYRVFYDNELYFFPSTAVYFSSYRPFKDMNWYNYDTAGVRVVQGEDPGT